MYLHILQVLSDTVADAMRNTGDNALSATIEFIEIDNFSVKVTSIVYYNTGEY